MMAIRTAKSHARQFSKFVPFRQWHIGQAGSHFAIIKLHACHNPGRDIANRRFSTMP